MSYFKVNMHQIRFRLAFRLRSRWELAAIPRPLAGFKRPNSNWREEGEEEGSGKGKGGSPVFAGMSRILASLSRVPA